MSREIDREVAEKVMGLMPIPNQEKYPFLYWRPKGDGHSNDIAHIPAFTTDPAAAHAVIARMGELGWWCQVMHHEDHTSHVRGGIRWDVLFSDDERVDEAKEKSFPLAVCKAALAALEAK